MSAAYTHVRLLRLLVLVLAHFHKYIIKQEE